MVVSGFAGSFNVIAVNGWMNTPEGFDVVGGKVANPRPWDALFNQNMWHEIIHMYLAGYIVCGFIVAGVYAFAWLRGRRDHYHRTALVVTLAFASLAAPVQVVVGDWAARTIAETQPVKLAAIEGLQHTEKGAPFTLGGFYDADTGEIRGGLEVPKLLSLLADHDPNGTVIGLDSVPEADRPPVNIVHWAFQTMVGIGTGLALLGVVFFVTWLRRTRLPRSPLVLPRGDGGRAAVVRRADRGLDHHRGRAPAVDRLRDDAHEPGGDVGERARGRLRGARRGLRQPRRRASCGCCGG